MARPPARGSPVLLIVFILLFVFTAAALTLMGMELARARKQLNEGFNPSAEGASQVDGMLGLKKALIESKRTLRDKDMELLYFKQITGSISAEDAKGKLDELFKRVRAVEESVPGAPEKRTLMGLIRDLELEKQRLQEKLTADLKTADSEKQKLEEQAKQETAKVKDREGTIAERDREIETLKEGQKNEIDRLKKESAGLRTELEAIGNKIKQVERDKNQEIAKLKRQIQELQDRLADRTGTSGPKIGEGATTGPEPARDPAVGKVVLVDRETGVIVDLGQKKGVRRGLRFQVFTEKADGSRIRRGDIEVKTVHPEISRAILLDGGNPADVIHQGDILVNPAFSPGRARVFVADSVFDAAKKQIFRDQLAEFGSVLEDELTGRTDYLIVGAAKGTLCEKAERQGVILIREEDLNVFLGR